MKRMIILLLIAIVSFSCKREFRPVVKTGLEGHPLPAFNILLPDSLTVFNTVNIPKGRPIVLLYFSPNCPYSQAEMRNIIKNMSTLKNVWFCILTNWPFRQLKGFYAYFKLNKYPNVIVGEDFENFFPQQYKPIGVPFTVIFNKDQKLKKAFLGTMPSKQIEEIALEG